MNQSSGFLRFFSLERALIIIYIGKLIEELDDFKSLSKSLKNRVLHQPNEF
jgi:hypothetical protein